MACVYSLNQKALFWLQKTIFPITKKTLFSISGSNSNSKRGQKSASSLAMGRSISSSRAVQENNSNMPSSGIKSSSSKNNNNTSISSARGRKPVATSTPYHGNRHVKNQKSQQKPAKVEEPEVLQEEQVIQQHMEVSLGCKFWGEIWPKIKL